SNMGCMGFERKALTIFIKALNDKLNHLPLRDKSYNYCEWKRIACDKETVYLVELNLWSLDLRR
ncbi:hypothetical protein ACLOJK_041725, partial [Asimina triloba]